MKFICCEIFVKLIFQKCHFGKVILLYINKFDIKCLKTLEIYKIFSEEREFHKNILFKNNYKKY